MAHLTQNPADPKRWVCLYPIFLNGEKTIAEGRRISKEKAVSNPPPSLPEIGEALRLLMLPATGEGKMHPRDFETMGRARVQIKNSEGKPLNPAITNRQQLFEAVAEKIKTLDRASIPRPEMPRLVLPPQQQAGPSGAGPSGISASDSGEASTSSGANPKKKGKKGRK
eukprot:comp8212_c0_seq1/m.3652 comp8212_c0_seq1/g.3652  ORF comp8212_c0_seq1/g.3652 comp8212_c0_seq1/m.3652 type:complete len:168 (-) comp8212_c0_seq1:550-1053(-)